MDNKFTPRRYILSFRDEEESFNIFFIIILKGKRKNARNAGNFYFYSLK